MTRKELIRLAREAGLDIPEDNPAYNLEFNLEELGVFAKLVTAEQQDWIASLEQNARDADRMYKELETELAASQAQIKVMRDALERFTKAFDDGEDTSDYWTWNAHANRMKEALNQPTDDSALRELLKAERERCAKVIERLISGDGVCADDGVWIHDCAAAIRAMEDQ